MTLEPDRGGDYGQDNSYSEFTTELAAGTFVGRLAEQARFREMLLDMVGTRKGFFGGLFGSSSNKSKNAKAWPIKSWVILIGGPAGSGKTRLAARLREMVQQDKDFSQRFRTIRLSWDEIFERDNRLAARLAGEEISPEILLDLIHNHCLRENGEPYFEAYRAAIEATRTLVKTVRGAELEAVWEYRARALGQGFRDWSNERPIILQMDDISLKLNNIKPIIETILEEAKSQFFLVLSGDNLPSDLHEKMQPERFATFQPAPFTPAEIKTFLEIELLRYRASRNLEEEAEALPTLSPGLIEQLAEITGGNPLACRLTAYLLQTGFSSGEIKAATNGEGETLEALAELFMAGPMGKGHPDRLKLYALAVLRRPEPGLLAALFDLRKDMLEIDETLERFNQRYAFLFEPDRPMSIHTALLPAFRHWLADPARRYDQPGLAKVNQHGLEYLDTRLQEWGTNFLTLSARLTDLKWREWALDKAWHSFWFGEDQGWPVALSLLVAGLGLQPGFARQVTALVERAVQAGLLDDRGRQRLAHFRETVTKPLAECRPVLKEFRMMGQEGRFFEKGLPQFAAELSKIIDSLLQ